MVYNMPYDNFQRKNLCDSEENPKGENFDVQRSGEEGREAESGPDSRKFYEKQFRP